MYFIYVHTYIYIHTYNSNSSSSYEIKNIDSGGKRKRGDFLLGEGWLSGKGFMEEHKMKVRSKNAFYT